MNNLLRRLTGCLLLIVCSFPLGATQGLPDLIDRIRPSVVAVGTVMPLRRPKARFYGTGFVVGDGSLVVTNYHVIPEVMNRVKHETLAVFSGRGKQAKTHQVEILRTDEDHDIALLKLDKGNLPALELGNADRVREGQSVAFTGFPIGMVLGLYPVTHRAIVSSVTPVVIPANNSKQLTAKAVKRLRKRFDVYQLDGTAYPGNSGSPVFDSRTGRVIGVLNSVLVKDTKETLLERPSGISYAIPVRFVETLLSTK